MKKRKITYSPTAQQRKEQKRQQEKQNQKEQTTEAEEAVATAPKTANIKIIIICIVANVLAVVLIVCAIFIPIWASAEKVTNDTFLAWENPEAQPIVTFTLTGDDKEEFRKIFGADEVELKYEIFISDAPYTSINLLYLVESDFYDGTIINDVKSGYAMINGFTDTKDDAMSNKARNVNFVDSLKGFVNHYVATYGKSDFRLGYRFSAETKRSMLNQRCLGYLCMLSGTSSSNYCTSTAYIFTTGENPQFTDAVSTTGNLSWVGKVVEPESQYKDVLSKLNGINTVKKGKFDCPAFNIRIKSAKTNLSSAKRKYLLNNFESIITKEAIWRDYAYNLSDYKFSS